VKELELKLEENDRDFKNRMTESSDRSHKVLKDLRNDYEIKMTDLKNKIKSLQMELDMERN
jgi:hypothetical protein